MNSMNSNVVTTSKPTDGSFDMPASPKATLAQRATKYRRGVAARLDEIQAAVEQLREDVHAVLATRNGKPKQEDRHAQS